MERATIQAASTKWYVLAGLARHIRAGMALLDVGAAATAATRAPGTLASVLTQAKSTALGALISLALAKGALSDVTAVVRQLLREVREERHCVCCGQGMLTA